MFFWNRSRGLLGFIVGADALRVDEEKIKTIRDWPSPTTVGEVRSFHSLAGFYRRFVQNFSSIAAPLTEVIKKNVGFNWERAQEEVFEILVKISDNAYQIDLKGKYDISPSFNVSDLSPFFADDPDLWTNPFEERGNDAPQSMDQYMEPDQIGDQADQNNSAEVRLPSRANQDDRAVYHLDPLTSGMELRPNPRPDIRTD